MPDSIQIEHLIASRLQDMAEQVEFLISQGSLDEAELLKTEGLHLAGCYDAGNLFMYLPDFTNR